MGRVRSEAGCASLPVSQVSSPAGTVAAAGPTEGAAGATVARPKWTLPTDPCPAPLCFTGRREGERRLKKTTPSISGKQIKQ